MSDDHRIFNEKEIARVLKRAAEIQGGQPRSTGYGLTIEELRQLANESGIDPAFVTTAAMELDVDQEANKRNWWGGPLSTTLLRSVPGTLSDAAWDEMLAVLRRDFKDTGVTEQRGTTRQWSLRSEGMKAHCIATEREGRTEFEFFSTNPAMAIPIYIIPLVFGIIALPVIFASLALAGGPGFALWLAVVSILFAGARTSVAAMATRARERAIQTAERVTAVAARRAESAVSRPSAVTIPEPVLKIASESAQHNSAGSESTANRSRTRN